MLGKGIIAAVDLHRSKPQLIKNNLSNRCGIVQSSNSFKIETILKRATVCQPRRLFEMHK